MSSKNNAPKNTPKQTEESDGPKPLAATLLQEFQNLKDKFKNEDDDADKGVKFTNFSAHGSY